MNSTNCNFKRDKKELIVFDRKYCKKLLDAEKVQEAKNYLKYFFFSYQNKIFFFNGYEFILYNRDDAIKLIPSDFKISIVVPNEHTKKFEKEEISLISFLKSTDFMDLEYKPTINFKNDNLIFTENKRIRGFNFEENYLNMAKPFNYDIITGKPIKQTEELTNNLNLIYNHIKCVLCSNDVNSYEYVLNFIACTFGGRKLRKALMLQSKERTGKGMIINDILKQTLGDRMFKTNSVESIMKYSKPFEGCCLINFDELPHCDNYKGMQDCLKSLITEPEFCCRDMYSSGYQQKNTFNIMITTNNDAVSLTQNNNTKYVCLDISEEKIGNHKYFETLNKAIKSENVLEQFYNEMMERFKTLDKWNEDNMPLTNTTKVKIIEALPRLYKYIKENYVLPQIDMDINMKLFLSDYQTITKDRTTPNKIGRMLKDIGVSVKKLSNNEGYNYISSAKELLEVYKNKNWLDELVDKIDEVEEIENTETKIKSSKSKSPFEHGLEEDELCEDDFDLVINESSKVIKETPADFNKILGNLDKKYSNSEKKVKNKKV